MQGHHVDPGEGVEAVAIGVTREPNIIGNVSLTLDADTRRFLDQLTTTPNSAPP